MTYRQWQKLVTLKQHTIVCGIPLPTNWYQTRQPNLVISEIWKPFMKFGDYFFSHLRSLSSGAVTIKSGTIALRMTSNRRFSDRSQTAYRVTTYFLRSLIRIFIFDVWIHYCKKYTQSEYKFTNTNFSMCFRHPIYWSLLQIILY